VRSNKTTIATAADESHALSLLNFLESSVNNIAKEKVVIYNLGLSETTVKQIRKDYPECIVKKYDFTGCPHHEQMKNNAGSYVWKIKIIQSELQSGTHYLVWMDAGNVIDSSLKPFALFSRFVQVMGFTTNYTIQDLTHKAALDTMRLDNSILNSFQISAAGLSFFNCSKTQKLVNNWAKSTEVKDKICPEGASKDNHRFDQSLLSIAINQSLIRRTILKHLTVKGLSNEFFGFRIHQDID